MFSVLILTLNEARNLPACLASVSFCADIVVLDSGSSDETCVIAEQAGARVFERPFDNFAGQRNHAHAHIAFAHPWVFHLDADETFPPELKTELERWITQCGEAFDGAWVAPRMMWQGVWVKHCTDFPAWQARLAHRDRFRFIEVGHGQREAPAMRMDRIAAGYRHDLSSGGVEAWRAKHQRYAVAEARAFLRTPTQASWRDLCQRDPLLRRRALKALSQQWPGRALLRFVYQYVLRGGILDGAAGFRYCMLLARYEGEIARQIRRQRVSLTP